MELDFIKEILNQQSSYSLLVKVTPQSPKNLLSPGQGNYLLQIYLTAKPTDGQANQALIKFLQKKLKPLLVDIKIIKGRRSAVKLLKIYLKK